MKRVLKLIEISIIIFFVLTVNFFVYATGRFVDIPVPPKNSGQADFSSEEGEEQAEEYEKEKKQNTAEDFIEKSGNNNLKNLEIQGYQLEPKFNSDIYDYELIINKRNVKQINVVAEAEDSKAKIEGIGEIEINKEKKIININVIAENGNLKVYTVKIVDNEEKKENNIIKTRAVAKQEIAEKHNIYSIILIITIIIIFMLCVKKILNVKKRKNK